MTRYELTALLNTLNRISVSGKQNLSDLHACITLVEKELAEANKEDS